MRIVVLETAEWEHEACLRLEPEHEVACTCEPLNERTAAGHADAEGAETIDRIRALSSREQDASGSIRKTNIALGITGDLT